MPEKRFLSAQLNRLYFGDPDPGDSFPGKPLPDVYYSGKPLKLRKSERKRQKLQEKQRKKRKRTAYHENHYLEYVERNKSLKEMGFNSYRAYLASKLWKKIRAEVLGDKPLCLICQKPAYEAHHLSYGKDVLLGKDLTQIVSLCGDCHHKIEFRNRDGKKLNPAQASGKLQQMLRKKSH